MIAAESGCACPLNSCSHVRENGGGKQQGGAHPESGSIADSIEQQAAEGRTYCDGELDYGYHQPAAGFGIIG
jgi:hypothetical protein